MAETSIYINELDKVSSANDSDILIIDTGTETKGITKANLLKDKQDTLVFNTAYDASTNKVATMADLMNAGGAQVIATITPAATVVITLTNKLTGDVYQGTTDISGIATINVNSYGSFAITYQAAGGITNAPRTINITNAGQIYQISAKYVTSATYTAKIDLSNSNPLSSITYLDDATSMTKGSSVWESQLIFKDIKPCVFKDGAINYYLNPDNFSQKADGTAANLDGTDGDVMIEFPHFGYKIYKDNGYLYVSITNEESAEGYHTYAFSKETEGDCNNFYWGAYKGSLNSAGNLQSIMGATPANNKTISAFKKLAQNRGDGYSITSYFQLVAIQCLYIIRYAYLHGQDAVGRGVCSTSAAIATGGTEDKGMFYGDTVGSATHVKVFGIEDFWGNIWEWIDGLTTDSAWNIITNWDYNGEAGHANFTTATGLTANIGGWVSNVSGTTESGFMPITVSGSSTTYFCDYSYLYSDRVLIFGGGWVSGDGCGPFYLNAYYTASDANSSVGARLMYLNN